MRRGSAETVSGFSEAVRFVRLPCHLAFAAHERVRLAMVGVLERLERVVGRGLDVVGVVERQAED